MITRLILSLKKAANSPSMVWSSGGTGQVDSVRFARRTAGGAERGSGDIVLRHLSSEGSDSLQSHDQG